MIFATSGVMFEFKCSATARCDLNLIDLLNSVLFAEESGIIREHRTF